MLNKDQELKEDLTQNVQSIQVNSTDLVKKETISDINKILDFEEYTKVYLKNIYENIKNDLQQKSLLVSDDFFFSEIADFKKEGLLID